ncbi:MAG: host-nuclease inhibitor Gam family protein [Candidatus Thiodiazotropha endolucinida]
MSNLKEIEGRAEAHAKARDVLNDRLMVLEEEKRRIFKNHAKALRAAAKKVAQTHDELRIEIEANPELFNKPKTRIFAGIQVGLRKSPGKMDFNPKKTIPAIKKQLPRQKKSLIKTEEKVITKAIGNLSADTVKKIGVKVIPGKDQVVIKPADSEITKLIDAWLSDLSEYEAAL